MRAETTTVVLHITECFEGGVGKAIRTYADNAPDFEHWLLASGAEVDDERKSDRFKRIEVLTGGLWSRTLKSRELASNSAVDLVHAHSSWAGVYSRLRRFAPPVIYQPHAYAFESGRFPRDAIFTIAEWLLARRAVSAIAVLTPWERRLAERLSNRTPIVLLPNAATVDEAAVKSSQGEGYRSVPMISTIGRISTQKDPAYFRELVRMVRSMSPDLRAVWIGDGDAGMRGELVRDGIEVTGWLDKSAIESVLDASSAYVHSARYEGFPLSVLDAAARRKPIFVRKIHAFDGSPLEQFDSLSSHARAVQRMLVDAEYAQVSMRRSADLLALMNATRQSAVLRELYGRSSSL